MAKCSTYGHRENMCAHAINPEELVEVFMKKAFFRL